MQHVQFTYVRNMFRQLVRKENQLWPYRKGKVNQLLKKGGGSGWFTINNLKYSTKEICFLVMHNQIMSSPSHQTWFKNYCYLVYYNLETDT